MNNYSWDVVLICAFENDIVRRRDVVLHVTLVRKSGSWAMAYDVKWAERGVGSGLCVTAASSSLI